MEKNRQALHDARQKLNADWGRAKAMAETQIKRELADMGYKRAEREVGSTGPNVGQMAGQGTVPPDQTPTYNVSNEVKEGDPLAQAGGSIIINEGTQGEVGSGAGDLGRTDIQTAVTGETFTQGTKVPEGILKNKPSYSPETNKWLESGGKITVENGTWKYTNQQGISVTYISGYPDFKGSGHVKQEIDINGFTDYYGDFKKADALSGGRTDPVNNTWHHLEDGKTLQEVNKKIHMQFTHNGGMSAIKR